METEELNFPRRVMHGAGEFGIAVIDKRFKSRATCLGTAHVERQWAGVLSGWFRFWLGSLLIGSSMGIVPGMLLARKGILFRFQIVFSMVL